VGWRSATNIIIYKFIFLATTGEKMESDHWKYEEVSVGEIKDLLLDDYEIEVDSPDGWVAVTDFIEKGNHKEHVLEVESGEKIRCSNKHLFETNKGWMFAEDIVNKTGIRVLHSDGSYKFASCKITGDYIPIVDITVDHENHRYYTNNVSSHNTGGGKSLVKCHMAASSLMFGKNVLYITMELAEEEVARRIDANIMDVTLDEVKELPLKTFKTRMDRYKTKTTGKLVIKEYPTGSAHVGHFRHLLNELRMKKNFVPDVIFVDYLNICASSRVRGAAAANSYTLVKSIAEEVRGLAMEFNCAIVTSSQFNRGAYESSDVELSNTSESMGITHTADAIFALITSEDLESRGQLMIKQLKNRWGDLGYYRRFLVGIDRARMKLFDLEDKAQADVQNEIQRNVGAPQQQKSNDDTSLFDKTSFGMSVNDKRKKIFETDGELT
jgi:hypothetical protein